MNPGYRALLSHLYALSQQAETGVVHLFTDKNEYGRLALVAGQITHLSLHTQRGPAALALLSKAAIRSHRFEAGAKLPATEGLLLTAELLAVLGSDPQQASASTGVLSAPIAVSIPMPTPLRASAAPPSRVAFAARQLIEAELSRELGPMAASLVHECLPRAADAEQLAALLAEQLTPREGAAYLERVRELLRALPAP